MSEPIRERLLATSGAMALTAVEGMGGVGKTIVAMELCHDERIRKTFSDGILWFTIGRQSGLTAETLIRQMAEAQNREFKVYNQVAYRSLLKEKSILVVLDDIWTPEILTPFLPDRGASRLLYTSRNREIAAATGATNYDVNILSESQSRRCLARWSGYESKPIPEPEATQILAECKGLVLSLAMIGATLRDKPAKEWERISKNVKSARLKGSLIQPADYAYKTLYASIAASVKELAPEDRARYLLLAILLEDLPAPAVLLQQIWGGGMDEVEDFMSKLVGLSLATRDANDNIRLHDFQLDYLRGENSDKEALTLEHSALLRSLHVVGSHPEQFASQMTGRLLAHRDQLGIGAFLRDLEASAPRPRLRPLWPTLQAADGQSLRILEGHTAEVIAVTLSADGRRAISSSDDQTVRVWDLDGIQPPRLLDGHTGRVLAVALSADGRQAASSSSDQIVRVWDLKGNQPPRLLDGHTGSVLTVALSADGTRAASGSSDQTVRVWDLESDQPPRILKGHTGQVNAVALSADGLRVVSYSEDRTVKIWDLEGNQPARIVKTLSGDWTVTLSGDGQRFVTWNSDSLEVWDLESHQSLCFQGKQDGWDHIRAVALAGDGKYVVSGMDDASLRVLVVERHSSPCTLQSYARSISSVALSGDGKRAVSGSVNGVLRVWDLQANQRNSQLKGHTRPVNAVALSGNGVRAVSGSNDGTVRVWDLEGYLPPRILHQAGSWGILVKAVALSGDGRYVVSGSTDATIRFWDLELDIPSLLEGHRGSVNAVALSVNGKRVISGSDDKTVRVWDAELLNRNLEGHCGILGSHNETFLDWSCEPESDQKQSRILNGHLLPVNAVALSVDGKRAVSGSDDETVRVWDLERNQQHRLLDGHTGRVLAVALAADGRCAASGSSDHTIRVWDLESDEPPRILRGHTGPVNALALSSDGHRAVSGSDDNTLRVWKLETGVCLAAFTCDARVLSCAWVWKQIVAGDCSDQVHLFAWEQ